MPVSSRPSKRVIRGLGPKVAAYRAANKLAIQYAAAAARLSIQTWRDCETHSLASDVTISKLSAIGVQLPPSARAA